MPRTKPIAGYPSRTDACLSLHGEGRTSREIALALGIQTTTVAALLSRSLGRESGAGHRRDAGRTVVVPADILDALAPHAARRGLSVNQLVRDLLDSVTDGLVDAVLDDAADLSPQPRKVSA